MGIQEFDAPRYAVGVYTDSGVVCVLEIYQDRISLEEGYKQFKIFASDLGLTKPVLGELSGCFMSADPKTGRTKMTGARFNLLTELIRDFSN